MKVDVNIEQNGYVLHISEIDSTHIRCGFIVNGETRKHMRVKTFRQGDQIMVTRCGITFDVTDILRGGNENA